MGKRGPFASDGIRRLIRLSLMQQSSPLTYARAKRLRRDMSEAERRLWYHLRGNRLNGFKFYRQVPIGPYIVDFINHEFGLVIEVDGATHGEAHEKAHDAQRDAYLAARGLQVLRFWNIDVFTNLSGVCDTIVMALEELRYKDLSLP
jgi:very-short-patch-repair endonuclease